MKRKLTRSQLRRLLLREVKLLNESVGETAMEIQDLAAKLQMADAKATANQKALARIIDRAAQLLMSSGGKGAAKIKKFVDSITFE